MTSFALDSLWRRSRDGLGVLAGSPPTWWSVTPAGATVLDALENGSPLPRNHTALTDRLLAGGAIHPVDPTPRAVADVTVVIPVLARDDAAHRSLAALVQTLAPLRAVVVDDGSPRPVAVEGAAVVRHDTPRGPSAARNTGLAHVDTSLVAFVDADAHVDADDLLRLSGHLTDTRVALVAPRVRATDGARLSWYEHDRSPLDLGGAPALVRPFSRVSYVPSAVIACQVSALRSAGGFDETLRWGEDVDLVWRLVAEEQWCRYDPSIVARHDVRQGLAALLVQRFRYGSSAGALAQRHGTIVAPFRAGVPLTVAALAFLTGWWLVAGAASGVTCAWYSLSLARRGLSRRGALTTAGMAVTRALYQSSVAVVRAWWPVAAAASVVTWRGGVALVLGATLPVAVDAVRLKVRPAKLPAWACVHLADDVAYSLGVWRGAVAARSPRCLLPSVSVPRRSVR